MATIKITNQNFQEEVLNSDKPVLLDFWATWCGPCMMVGPILEEISEEMPHIKIGKINVDEEAELAMKYQIMSIPTLILMVDGQIKTKSIGAQPKENIINMLK